MRYNSLVFRNMCIFFKMFNWRDSDFISGRVSMSQQYFIKCLQCFDAVGWAAGRASGL